MTDLIVLKPCPFCGCTEIIQDFDNKIRCSNIGCEAAMDCGHFCGRGAREAMAEAWNKRSYPVSHPFLITYTAIDKIFGDAKIMQAACPSKEAGLSIIRDMAEKHKKDAGYKDFQHILTLSENGKIIHTETDCA